MEEAGVLGEGAAGEFLQELGEVRLGRIEILVAVVGQAPVVLDGVVPFRPVGQDREVLEQLGRARILLLVEILEGRPVLGIDVVAAQQRLVFGLAGGEGKQARPKGSSRKRSASRAAMQPEAAAVTAWR